jgi:predicted aldo/keto reductase-like oxidoreductase
MHYRKLGKTGFEISEIGFGAWGIGGKQWLGGEDNESLNALRRAIDLGVNFIDTALAYGDGHSEVLVGKVVRDREAFVREKGKGAVGPLMGVVMAELKGKLDGKAASELLRKEIDKLLSS